MCSLLACGTAPTPSVGTVSHPSVVSAPASVSTSACVVATTPPTMLDVPGDRHMP